MGAECLVTWCLVSRGIGEGRGRGTATRIQDTGVRGAMHTKPSGGLMPWRLASCGDALNRLGDV